MWWTQQASVDQVIKSHKIVSYKDRNTSQLLKKEHTTHKNIKTSAGYTMKTTMACVSYLVMPLCFDDIIRLFAKGCVLNVKTTRTNFLSATTETPCAWAKMQWRPIWITTMTIIAENVGWVIWSVILSCRVKRWYLLHLNISFPFTVAQRLARRRNDALCRSHRWRQWFSISIWPRHQSRSYVGDVQNSISESPVLPSQGDRKLWLWRRPPPSGLSGWRQNYLCSRYQERQRRRHQGGRLGRIVWLNRLFSLKWRLRRALRWYI